MKTGMSHGTNVKTGISVNKDLARRADELAHKMGVTRSGLYAMALQEYIQRHDNLRLLEKLNVAYGADNEDELLIQGIKRHSRRVLDEED